MLKQESGLRLDAGSLVRLGSEDGSILDVAHPLQSRLIERVTTTDLSQRMPPEGQGTSLNDRQINILVEWIESGATSPVDERVIASPKATLVIPTPRQATASKHRTQTTPHNPIDAWMLAKRREAGLVSTPQANPETLLRRVYLDVIGLPPTIEQQDEWLEQSDPKIGASL